MSGLYPDIPGPKIAYDRDGTIVAGLTFDKASIQTTMTTAQKQEVNNNNPAAVNPFFSTGCPIFLFPVLHDLVGIYAANINDSAGAVRTIEWSPNTTNGVDGTWNNGPTLNFPGGSYAANNGADSRVLQRTSIQPLSLTGVKAIRFRAGFDDRIWTSIHIYGKPSTPAERLEFWHPTLDQPLSQTPAHLDWGDRPRGTEVTRQVRVKNRSSVLTASTITVGMEALTDATPTVVSQHQFSLDGTTWASTITIPSLGAGVVSGTVHIRQSLSPTAEVSLWDQRIYAAAGDWS